MDAAMMETAMEFLWAAYHGGLAKTAWEFEWTLDWERVGRIVGRGV